MIKTVPLCSALSLVLAVLTMNTSSYGSDVVARSNYMIVQEDHAVPPPPSEIEPSPSDLRPAPEPEPVVPPAPVLADEPWPEALSSASSTESGADPAGWGAEPWTLPQPYWLQRRGISLGGWLQHGITFNANNPPDGFNGPVAANDLDGEYQMNQLWLYLVRPVDTGGCGWDIGGRIDMMYGTDWRFGINKGLEDRINSFNRQTYGMVLPQFYLEVGYNHLSVKLGHFAGILDYEAIPAPLNPFYSHSYSYGYTVPQLVTGVLSDWRMTDQLSLQAGVHRGWMQFESWNDDWDVMAGVRWESCDGRTSLAYALSSGRQSFQPVLPFDNDNRFVYSLVAQRQLTGRLRYVMVHNLGYEKNSIFREDAEWYGLNQYLLYQINPRWSANLRTEWLRDDDGVRIAGPGNIPGIRAWDGAGYAGNFYEVTAGVNWHPRSNITFRPEVRYDWYSGAASRIENKPALPFDGGASSNQWLFGVDMIVTF